MLLRIVARTVELTEVTRDDIPILHKWRNETGFRGFCSTRRNELGADEFEQELARDFDRDRHLQMLVRHAGTPVGTIYSYSFNRTDGHAFVTTYVDPRYERMGYGAEAFMLFAYHLFTTYSLFKLYTDVYEHNDHSYRCLSRAGFAEEGRFRSHRLVNEKRYDLIRLALYSDQVSKWEPLIRRLQGSIPNKGDGIHGAP